MSCEDFMKAHPNPLEARAFLLNLEGAADDDDENGLDKA
jgi:hypothetical protein